MNFEQVADEIMRLYKDGPSALLTKVGFITLRKGDLPGHEFYGNQYSSGTGVQPIHSTPEDAEHYHREAQHAHERLSSEAGDMTTEEGAVHTAAADAHFRALNSLQMRTPMERQGKKYREAAAAAHVSTMEAGGIPRRIH